MPGIGPSRTGRVSATTPLAGPDTLPSWLVNVAEAPRLGGPSPRARLYQQVGVSPRGVNQAYSGYTGAGRVGMDTGLPYEASGLAGGNLLPVMTGRNASRALVYSKVDKEIAREVAAMRQILRKQQELLPKLAPEYQGRE